MDKKTYKMIATCPNCGAQQAVDLRKGYEIDGDGLECLYCGNVGGAFSHMGICKSWTFRKPDKMHMDSHSAGADKIESMLALIRKEFDDAVLLERVWGHSCTGQLRVDTAFEKIMRLISLEKSQARMAEAERLLAWSQSMARRGDSLEMIDKYHAEVNAFLASKEK